MIMWNRYNTNFGAETEFALESNGKKKSDVVWVGFEDERIPVDLFWELAEKTNYDSGYGGAEIPTGPLVVGDGWWLERAEYDGSEWWEFKTTPKMPEKVIYPADIVNIE